MSRRFRIASARIAWRDLSASRLNSALIVIALAVSAAGISGVRSAAEAARQALRSNSRQWLAADISVNTKAWPSELQTTALNQMRSQGVDWTVVTSAMTMASSDQSPDAGFAAVKAIDPGAYPYYGDLALSPPLRLAEAVNSDTVVVSPDMLARLEVRIGDSIRVGAGRYRIAAVIGSEPDRFAGTPSIGMRCILSRDGYVRSGIARAGNSELHRILLRLPVSASSVETRHQLEELFPEADVLEYRDANQPAAAAVDMLSSSLGMTSFVALALGIVGVVIAVREHVEQRMNTIAVMKTLGAREAQVVCILLWQIAGMVACAWLISIPLAWTVRFTVLSYAGRFLPLGAASGWNARIFAESAAACIIASVPAVFQPLLMIRGMRPAVVLRKDTELVLPASAPENRIVVGLACAGLAVITARMLGSWTAAASILISLGTSAAATWMVSGLLLRVLRSRATSVTFCARRPLMRLALRNLARSAIRSRMMIFALSMGLMTLVGSFEVDRAIARVVADSLPFDRANLFVAGFNDSHREILLQFLAGQAGVEGPAELMTLARLRLRSVNGKPAAGSGTWLVGCLAGQRGLTVADDVARTLGLNVGSGVEFAGRENTLHATVTAVTKMPRLEKVWFSFRIDCAALAGQDLFHHAAIRVSPDNVAAVKQAVARQFPTLPVITGAELADTVLGAVDEEAKLVRTLGWFRMVAGLCVLIAVVSASRTSRLREIGILSSLGATKAKLIRIYAAEFVVIGLFSGVIGNLLACVFTSVSLGLVFGRTIVAVDWKVVSAALLIAPLITLCAGLLPAWGLPGAKPMTILRRE